MSQSQTNPDSPTEQPSTPGPVRSGRPRTRSRSKSARPKTPTLPADTDDEQEMPGEKPEDFVTPKQQSPRSPKTSPKFFEGLTNITDLQKKLLEELYLANGQDAYDAEAAAVGKLRKEEYLALPRGISIPQLPPNAVGDARTRELFSAADLIAIYHLNKLRAPPGENAAAYGFIRMEAVKIGWVSNQREVVTVARPPLQESLEIFQADFASHKEQLEEFKLAAFLIPLVCEHTFRTMGHHYITGLAAEYQTRYRKTLRACLHEGLMQLLQPPTLFHHVLHWVSPARSFAVLAAKLGSTSLPDALVIRATSAPAGTAIITTTSAVLDAMVSANIYEAVKEEFAQDLDVVRIAAANIKRDVRKWHKAYYAYNVSPPTPDEMNAMEASRDIAIAFAPYAQGFIDGTLKEAALGQAKALTKHADLNPIVKMRAARFFRKLARTEADTVANLFKNEIRVKRRNDDDDDGVLV